MAGLGRMDELRRRAGGGEGGGDLAGDMAALAHAGDDDAPGHARPGDRAPRPTRRPGSPRQAHQGLGLLAQDALRRRQPVGPRLSAGAARRWTLRALATRTLGCASLASPLARAVTALSSIYGGNPSRLAGP